MLVQSGSYEVGALNKQVFEERVRRNKVDNSKVQVIWETPTYADYHWLAQPDLDNRFGKGFTKKLKRTLLELNRESKYQANILDLFGAKKFISANESQYIKIEKIGRHLGKIK
jgi:phosphonate transport system substrate-binding protein